MSKEDLRGLGLKDNVIESMYDEKEGTIRTKTCDRCHEIKTLLHFYVKHDVYNAEEWYAWCNSCELESDFPELLDDALGRLLNSSTISTANKKIQDATGRRPVSLKINQLRDIWNKQHGKCFFWHHKQLSPRLPGPFQISIDRISYDRPFNENNIFLVCREFVGILKWNREKINTLKREYLERKNNNNKKPTSSLWGLELENIRSSKSKFLQTIVNRCIKKDKETGKLEKTVSFADLVLIYENQRGKCYISGKDMELRSKSEWMLCIKRVDLKLGFSVDNVRLICFEFNSAKWTPQMYEEWMACETNTCKCAVATATPVSVGIGSAKEGSSVSMILE
jgi:hypothetical protein